MLLFFPTGRIEGKPSVNHITIAAKYFALGVPSEDDKSYARNNNTKARG
jgi:hypothetical protein